jgi:phosphoglycolate phosphatase
MKLAVWDVDGTLVDSRASILRALQEGAVAVGLTPPDYDEARHIVGLSLLEAVQTLRPEISLEHAEAYAHQYKQSFIRFHTEEGFHEPLYDGAESCLRRLKAEGWRLGMATGKSRRGIERNEDFFGWQGLFDATFCGDDGPSKPHPFMIERNMEVVGARPHETIMIGDTGHDIGMARAAGVYAIGVSWGFHTVAELEAAGAHDIVHSYDDLNARLDAFGAQITDQVATIKV